MRYASAVADVVVPVDVVAKIVIQSVDLACWHLNGFSIYISNQKLISLFLCYAVVIAVAIAVAAVLFVAACRRYCHCLCLIS